MSEVCDVQALQWCRFAACAAPERETQLDLTSESESAEFGVSRLPSECPPRWDEEWSEVQGRSRRLLHVRRMLAMLAACQLGSPGDGTAGLWLWSYQDFYASWSMLSLGVEDFRTPKRSMPR